MYVSSLVSLPPHPTPRGCYRAAVSAPRVTEQIPTGSVPRRLMHMLLRASLGSSHPLLPRRVLSLLTVVLNINLLLK